MKFIVDTQLPPRLAAYLTSKGFESIHTTHFKDGHLLDDKEIIVIVKKEERGVTTKDSDFFDNYLLKGSPPKVLLIQFKNVNNRDLFKLFDLHLDKIIDAFRVGNNIVLFRRDSIIGY